MDLVKELSFFWWFRNPRALTYSTYLYQFPYVYNLILLSYILEIRKEKDRNYEGNEEKMKIEKDQRNSLWIGFLAVKILMIEDLSGKNIFMKCQSSR